MVEGEAGAVRRSVRVGGFDCGVQVPGGDAGLEDYPGVAFVYTMTVVQHRKGPVAAAAEDRCRVDVAGSGVAGVAEKFDQGVLDGGDARGSAAGALGAGKAGETGSEVAVWAFAVRLGYRATSLTRLSRITVTLICPGYSRLSSICFEISRASLAAIRSSTSEGWTITRTSRPACIA